MSSKSTPIKTSNVLSFNNQEERYQLSDEMISLRFLSQVKSIMDLGDDNNEKISKAELAKRLGTSASYVTQLFQGDKIINVRLLTKIKNALNVKIDIVCYPKSEPKVSLNSIDVPQLGQGTPFISSNAFPNAVNAITNVVISNQEVFHTSLTTTSQENSSFSYEEEYTYAAEYNGE